MSYAGCDLHVRDQYGSSVMVNSWLITVSSVMLLFSFASNTIHETVMPLHRIFAKLLLALTIWTPAKTGMASPAMP